MISVYEGAPWPRRWLRLRLLMLAAVTWSVRRDWASPDNRCRWSLWGAVAGEASGGRVLRISAGSTAGMKVRAKIPAAPASTEEEPEWFSPFSTPMMQLASLHLGLCESDRALVLELGCGRRCRALELGLGRATRTVGIDIDMESLRYAENHHSHAWHVLGNIERLPFEDCTFDAVFSFSVLQYVDWRRVVARCERLLKPCGRAAFIETLAGNPIARAYRRIHRSLGWKYAPSQTPRKHIAWDEVGRFREVFHEVTVEPFHLFAPLALVVPAFQKGVSGAPMHVGSQRVFDTLRTLDELLLRKLPLLRRYSWMIVIRATKRGLRE